MDDIAKNRAIEFEDGTVIIVALAKGLGVIDNIDYPYVTLYPSDDPKGFWVWRHKMLPDCDTIKLCRQKNFGSLKHFFISADGPFQLEEQASYAAWLQEHYWNDASPTAETTDPQKCTCDMEILMTQGCQCGGE